MAKNLQDDDNFNLSSDDLEAIKAIANNIGGSMSDDARAKKIEELKKVFDRIAKSVSKNAHEYNLVYRQASTNLTVVAGILLAFVTGFISQLQSSENIVKGLALAVIATLTASLAFGVIQQLMEAQFFRAPAMKKINMVESLLAKRVRSAEKIQGMLDQIDARPHAVSRWSSIVQISLLAAALLLIIAVVALYLFI